MARVTLRLPDDLHRQLRSETERSESSLNQVIVAALRDALARAEMTKDAQGSLLDQVQRVRRALGDLAVELDTQCLPSRLGPSECTKDTDALRQAMPELSPPLSATIIADREDRC